MVSSDLAVATGAVPATYDAASHVRAFRDALGRYSTGVAVITAETAHGPVGMAVNSFTSVSLTPPLVSFCAMVDSASWSGIRGSGRFAVSVLTAQHEHVARRFARRGVDRFAGSTWFSSPAGHPVLGDALSWFDAAIASVTVAGDHDLVVAGVEAFSEPADGEPLVFFGGSYGSFAP